MASKHIEQTHDDEPPIVPRVQHDSAAPLSCLCASRANADSWGNEWSHKKMCPPASIDRGIVFHLLQLCDLGELLERPS
jgi:hypothetical protein